MNINDKSLMQYIKEKKKGANHHNVTSITLDNKNINEISFKTLLWERIEYLSLQHNYIRNITFLKQLPNLFYLDLRNNHIEDFDMINFKNTFAFLGLSSDKYSAKEVLSIKRINVGILYLTIEDPTHRKIFLMNNPNILKFNEEFMNFTDFSLIGLGPKSNFVTSFSPMKKHSVAEYITTPNRTSSLEPLGTYSPKKIVQQLTGPSLHVFGNIKSLVLNTSNDKTKSIFDFFENYTRELNELLKFTTLNSITITENDKFLLLERKKFIKLAEINSLIFKLNSNEANCVCDEIHIYKHYTNLQLFKIKDDFLQIIILDVLALFIFNIIGKEFAYVILKKVFARMTLTGKELNQNELKLFFELDLIFQMGIYFDLYEHYLEIHKRVDAFSDKMSFDSGKGRYDDIVKILRLNKIILHVMTLKTNKINTNRLFTTKSNSIELRKRLINLILFNVIEEKLKMFEDVLKLIQFLGDFISYSNMEENLIKEHTGNFRLFMEVKGLMFIKLDKKLRNNSIYISLSDRAFADHNQKRLGNKMYFANNNLKKEEVVCAFEGVLNRIHSKKKCVNLTEGSVKNGPNGVSSMSKTVYSFAAKKRYGKAVKLEKNNLSRLKNYKSTNTSLIENESSLDYNTHIDNDNAVRLIKPRHTHTVKLNSYTKSQINFTNDTQAKRMSHNEETSVTPFSITHNVLDKKTQKLKYKEDMQTGRSKSMPFDLSSIKFYDVSSYKALLSSSKAKQTKSKIGALPKLNETEDILNFELASEKSTWKPSNTHLHFHKTDKTIYDFKANLQRLTHHWNKNNTNVVNASKKPVANSNDNFMAAEEIFKLFSIASKNDEIKEKIIPKEEENKKYTLKLTNSTYKV